MRKMILGLVVALALWAVQERPARAETQTIRGEKLLVKGSRIDPKQRKVFVSAAQEDGTIVGDPPVVGGSLRLIARGPGAAYDQTFALPAPGWRKIDAGYQFRNTGVGGAVTSVWIGRGRSRSGTPGPFKIKIRAQGESGALEVLPPGPGAEGGAILTLGGGERYCIAFGGEAGGKIDANHAGTFAVRAATGRGCPEAASPAASITPRPPASRGPD